MPKLFAALVMFVMIISSIKIGKSLRCYVCRTDIDKNCEEPFNKSYLIECPEKENASKLYCRKIEQKLRFKTDNIYASIRECAYQKGSQSCYKFKWVQLAHQETCECDKDSCNRGYNLMPDSLSLIIIAFFWLIRCLVEQ